jgi:hypothetical protein
LEYLGRLIELARLPAHEQAAAESALSADPRWRPDRLITLRLWGPWTKNFAQTHRRKVALMRCLVVALAVEGYRRQHGRWPERLEGLVGKGLQAIPLDPFDGKPLRYRRVADGVVIYSVSTDGTDNGGNIDRRRFLEPGVDLGYRLFDVSKRGQEAKPEPPPKP